MSCSALGGELASQVAEAKVLVVGTGGIGCELLKNLVLTGFRDIVAIDLDTIDVSNLNRQFLFQKQHVGRSKVEVARETALTFNPSVKIEALHDSITNPRYNVNFFKQFTLVMNALDNKAARSHVNRLCLAANMPLVESGSAGYQGQVTVIRKGHSECYECTPPPATKTFPGCTIRNTPSQPIHCIVWAKHLFSQLFGEPDADNDVSPETSDPEQVDEMQVDATNGNSEMVNSTSHEDNGKVTERISTREWAEKNCYSPTKLFHKLFHSDIEYLLSMEKLWQTRTPPNPLELSSLPDTGSSSTEEPSSSRDSLPDQKVWSPKKCGDMFVQCVRMLKGRFESDKELVWDKDDKTSLDFVVAASNLRAFNYHITLKSRFDVKSMAGSIIPAIATTNAVIAALMVMEALKLVAGEFHRCKMTFLPKYPNPRKRLPVSYSLLPPNPKCYVCSPRPEVAVKMNSNSVTVATLQDKILKSHFGMVAPDVEIDDGKGTILVSSEEGETEENLPRRLAEFGVSDGCRLKCDDFLQNYQLVVAIMHSDEPLEDEAEFQVVTSQGEGETPQVDMTVLNTRKRKAPSLEDGDRDNKRPRTSTDSSGVLEV